MLWENFVNETKSFVEHNSDNRVADHIALAPSLAGMKIFEEPIFAVGNADDEYFHLLKEQNILGSMYMMPRQWLSQAKRVVSIFLPFSNIVIEENRKDSKLPSLSWLHARIEGQAFIEELLKHLTGYFANCGSLCVAPTIDSRFYSILAPHFTSNWSERHVAYGCGLGTFGLSKGIITEKGMAGRLCSIITDEEFPVTKKAYQTLYEYCILCGKCIRQCPVQAISKAGKEHVPCSGYLDEVMEQYFPRYGCGKCQVGVPCEQKIPQ